MSDIDIGTIETGLGKDEQKEVLKSLLRQTEIDLFATLQLASVCKTVGDEKGLEVHKAAALKFNKKKSEFEKLLNSLTKEGM